MSDRDTITLPREVVEKARKALTPMAYHTPPYERGEIAAALRTALAAEQPKPEPVRCNPADYCAARHMNLYTAPPATHPGYVIGSHWLETAYSRICAGEAEADVLRDIGLVRITDGTVETVDIDAIVDHQKALRRDAERYRWLRDKAPPDIGDMASVRDSHDPFEIDAAIDAAMGDKR